MKGRKKRGQGERALGCGWGMVFRSFGVADVPCGWLRLMAMEERAQLPGTELRDITGLELIDSDGLITAYRILFD